MLFLKRCHSLHLFLYFRLFIKVDSKLNGPTTGFEPHISGVGNDLSTTAS